MKRIVLVYPPISFGKKRSFGFPPLGILYIASFLRKEKIDVKVIDSFIEGHTLEGLIEIILKIKPDVVGFSMMTCQVNSVLEVARRLKQANPSLLIVAGGPHISSTREEFFKFTKDIDFLFYGEAERTFSKFVSSLNGNGDFEGIDGLIYQKDGKVIINSPPKPIENLDELPFPDFKLIDIHKYDSYYAKSLPLASLIGSRGCPYSCTFCDAYATHGKTLRLRSPKNIVDEMEYNCLNNRIRQFMIKDSTFTVNKKWVYEICSLIIKRGLKISWTCNSRVDLVDREILKIMKKSGCYMILFGIESGSQKVLDSLKKNITIEQIKKGISFCKKERISAAGYFMIGNPQETEEDAQRTLKLSKELNLDLATFGVTTAYPGTEFYEWAVNNNALQDRFWYMRRDLNVANSVREVSGNLSLEYFPLNRQTEIVKKANREFYLRTPFIIKNIFKIRGIYDFKRAVKSVRELL